MRRHAKVPATEQPGLCHLENWHTLDFLGHSCLETCLRGNASDATGTSEQSWLTLQGGQQWDGLPQSMGSAHWDTSDD